MNEKGQENLRTELIDAIQADPFEVWVQAFANVMMQFPVDCQRLIDVQQKRQLPLASKNLELVQKRDEDLFRRVFELMTTIHAILDFRDLYPYYDQLLVPGSDKKSLLELEEARIVLIDLLNCINHPAECVSNNRMILALPRIMGISEDEKAIMEEFVASEI